MKRSLIALGVAAAVAFPVAANAAPTVYGKLNLSVQNEDVDGAASDVWQVASNASRLGVKGDEKLSDALSVVYLIEYGVSGDGNGTDWETRNRWLGLKSTDLGTLKLGRNDTYFKQAELKTDLFNDLAGDFEKILGGQGGPARANNVIDYSSPKLADLLTVNVQLLQGEGTTPIGSTSPDDGLGDGISSSLVFATGDFSAALAYNKDVVTRFADSGGNGFKADGFRLNANYAIKDIGLSLGALYQSLKTTDLTGPKTKEDGFLVSAALKFASDWTAKVQYGQSSTDNARTGAGVVKAAGDENPDRTQYGIGLDYALAKSTRAFGFYNVLNRDGAADVDTTTYGIGLEHNF